MRTRATRYIKTLIVAVFTCLYSPFAHPMDNSSPYFSTAPNGKRIPNQTQFSAISDLEDAKGKANSLIQYAFDLKPFKSNQIILNVRDKIVKALTSMINQDRQLVYNSLIKPITVNRKDTYISKILFYTILRNEKAAQTATPSSFRNLFSAIVQISSHENDLSKIISPIMSSNQSLILKKPPQEQALIITGVSAIEERKRTLILGKSTQTGLLKITTPITTIIQIFKIIEHISNTDIRDYKIFITEQQKRRVFPKVISPDDFPKIFAVFYQARDKNYQSLITTAFTKGLINNAMSLDNILIILKAFNLIEPSIQSDFIDTLRTRLLLIDGMKDEDIASTLKDLSAVPISEPGPSSSIPSIHEELLKRKIINPSYEGQNTAGLIRTVYESFNKEDTYGRLSAIANLKSSTFLDEDILELYKKLAILNIPSHDFYQVMGIYQRYLYNIREWGYTSVFKILNAIGAITAKNREPAINQAKQSLMGRNDQTLESVIQTIINAGSSQFTSFPITNGRY